MSGLLDEDDDLLLGEADVEDDDADDDFLLRTSVLMRAARAAMRPAGLRASSTMP